MPNFRTLAIFSVIILVACLATLLMKANVSQQYRKRVAVYEDQFVLQETIDVLQGEWAMFTNPIRLETQARGLGWEKLPDRAWASVSITTPKGAR